MWVLVHKIKYFGQLRPHTLPLSRAHSWYDRAASRQLVAALLKDEGTSSPSNHVVPYSLAILHAFIVAFDA